MPTLAYDVETLPNLFMAQFVDVDSEKDWLFTIYDEWDEYDNAFMWQRLREHINQPDLTLVGYNSWGFDNIFLARILDTRFQRPLTCEGLFNLSQTIINVPRDSWSDRLKRTINKWKYWNHKFESIDLMEIISVNMNRPSLKHVSIHLKWPRLQDLPLPYDHYVREHEIPLIARYNKNDTGITKALYWEVQGEIEIRRRSGRKYGVDLLSSSDSKIANVVLEHKYGKPNVRETIRTNIVGRELLPSQYSFSSSELYNLVRHLSCFNLTRGTCDDEGELVDQVDHNNSLSRIGSSKRKKFRFEVDDGHIEISLKDGFSLPLEISSARIIFDLAKRKKLYCDGITKEWGKEDYTYEFDFGGNTYSFGVGGLHSKDEPGIFKSDDTWTIRDADVTSYYPFMIINEKFVPAHLDEERFLSVLSNILDDKLSATDKAEKGVAKISVNAVFGKMNFRGFWLYDEKPFYSTTISGQIYILDLVEKFYLHGIQVISANTDGVTCRIHQDQEDVYNAICKEWQERTELNLEFVDYELYARLNVNSYLALPKDGGRPKLRNDFVSKKSFNKGFKHPITAIALQRYFIDNTPVEETIRNHDDIYDFMMTQRCGKKFQQYFETTSGREKIQRTNRFIASTKGGVLYKESLTGKRISLLSGRYVTILNDVESPHPRDYPVDFGFYIKKCTEILDKIEPKQISMFDLMGVK